MDPVPSPVRANCLSEAPGIAHGFFTRAGGVSAGVYGTLNCGLGSRDDRNAVMENRARVAGSLGALPDRLVTVYQVHSACALVIDRPVGGAALPRADALVTRTPGLAIGVLTADCAPVLLADPQGPIVAAAHAGWRGALSGILEATITMMESLGADRRRIRAAVGPCIQQAAYEVGPEFEAEFLGRDAQNAQFFVRGENDERTRFDLPGFVCRLLRRLGVSEIEDTSLCTYENESLFFSYRRSLHRQEGDYGRQISAIVVT